MLKHTFFRRTLAKLPPTHKAIAVKHFNETWESYQRRTSYPRYLYANRLISLTHFRKLINPDFIAFRRDLRERLKTLAALV
jgi:hypothetical protein